MAVINFGGTKEQVVTRKEFPMAKARKVLKGETVAIIGYGVQGPAQSLNLRDNGFKVIIGQSRQFRRDWDRALKDGWTPGKDLFEIAEACGRGTIIEMLVSDAGQRAIWPVVKERLVNLGNDPMDMSSQDFARFVRSEIEDYQRVIKAAGIKPQ